MNKFYQMSFLMVLFMHISGVFAIETDVTINVRLAPGEGKKITNEALDALQESFLPQSQNDQNSLKGEEYRQQVRSDGKELVRDLVADVINSGLQGVEKATEGKEVQNIIRNITGNVSKGASAGYADAMENAELRANLERGGNATAGSIGAGARGFREGMEREFWPQAKQGFRDAVSSFLNFRNSTEYGSIIALGIALPLAGIYGSRVLWNVIEKRLTNPKPEIVVKQANPVFGRWDRIRRWWRGYKTPPMIFDQSVKDRLTQIEEKTKAIRDLIYQGRKMTYDNLLLYGKPGTGKTLFAQILADKTNMDFLPVTAASLLQSGVEGIKYFNELLELASRSKYGVIIFIDEADALFVDRNNLSPDSDHYKVLNHILAITGSGSNKFMIIAATNHAYVMDEAMGRRFQDRVHMPLPDAATRRELLDLYCAATLLNNKENSAEFVAKAKALLTPALINTIVEKTAGLSHAEIKDMISTMNKASQITTVTAKIIRDTVGQAVEKHRVLEKEKAQREERFAAKKEQSAIPVA